MNVTGFLSVLGLLAAAASAQSPVPCHTPPLMSGSMSVMSASGLMSTGKISYDAFSQRLRVRNFGVVGNETFALDMLMLFNKKVYYEIDYSRFSCKKRALDSTFIPMQVPADSQLMGQVVLGSSSSWGMGVVTNTWYGDLPGNGKHMSVFTETGCIPVTIMGYTPASGWTTVSTFNWLVGISDPMDFMPPFFCGKSDLEVSDTPDTVFTALESLAKKAKSLE